MMNHPPRTTRLLLLRGALLTFAVLTSAAAAVVVGFAVYLFAQGYSGGDNPQSVAPLAFPISLVILAVVGVPLALASAASWAGYLTANRKHRQFSR
jgi:drug/metabolite transporter (DMT)-like permease